MRLQVVKIHVTLQVPDWGIPWQARLRKAPPTQKTDEPNGCWAGAAPRHVCSGAGKLPLNDRSPLH